MVLPSKINNFKRTNKDQKQLGSAKQSKMPEKIGNFWILVSMLAYLLRMGLEKESNALAYANNYEAILVNRHNPTGANLFLITVCTCHDSLPNRKQFSGRKIFSQRKVVKQMAFKRHTHWQNQLWQWKFQLFGVILLLQRLTLFLDGTYCKPSALHTIIIKCKMAQR